MRLTILIGQGEDVTTSLPSVLSPPSRSSCDAARGEHASGPEFAHAKPERWLGDERGQYPVVGERDEPLAAEAAVDLSHDHSASVPTRMRRSLAAKRAARDIEAD